MSNKDLIKEARISYCPDCDHFTRAMADALETAEAEIARLKSRSFELPEYFSPKPPMTVNRVQGVDTRPPTA